MKLRPLMKIKIQINLAIKGYREQFVVREEVGLKVTEQCAKLLQVVLEWGAGQQEAILGLDLLEFHRETAILVLKPVAFIDDDVCPMHFLQHWTQGYRRLVTRNNKREMPYINLWRTVLIVLACGMYRSA